MVLSYEDKEKDPKQDSFREIAIQKQTRKQNSYKKKLGTLLSENFMLESHHSQVRDKS